MMANSKDKNARPLKQRVKTARKRTISSTLWLERQLNDPYVAKARLEGYRSRAAFKLLEMDQRYPIFKPGQIVVDLGAAPGGWSEVAAKKIKAPEGKGHVIAIDLLAVEGIAGVTFQQLDFLDPEAPRILLEMLQGRRADVVMSDMAANTTGHKKTDHIKIVALAEAAAEFACEILNPGGHFVAKVLQGGTEGELLSLLKTRFKTVRHVKPPASRADSAELYVLAQGFRT